MIITIPLADSVTGRLLLEHIRARLAGLFHFQDGEPATVIPTLGVRNPALSLRSL